RANDRALRLEAHHAMWATSVWLAELSAAEHHIERGISLYDPEKDRPLAFLYGGHDPLVCCRHFSVWTRWLSGCPVQAAAASRGVIAFAEQLAHPPSLAQALAWTSGLFFFERNGPAAGQEARRLTDLATEWEMPAWRAVGAIIEGWSRADAGDRSVGIPQIRDGLIAARATGTLMPLEPFYLMVFA